MDQHNGKNRVRRSGYPKRYTDVSVQILGGGNLLLLRAHWQKISLRAKFSLITEGKDQTDALLI